MKQVAVVLILLMFIIQAHAQQKVIPLYNAAAPDSENWNWNEGESE